MCCRHISGAWQSNKCRLTLEFLVGCFYVWSLQCVQSAAKGSICLSPRCIARDCPRRNVLLHPQVSLAHIRDRSCMLFVRMTCDFPYRGTGCFGDGAWSDSSHLEKHVFGGAACDWYEGKEGYSTLPVPYCTTLEPSTKVLCSCKFSKKGVARDKRNTAWAAPKRGKDWNIFLPVIRYQRSNKEDLVPGNHLQSNTNYLFSAWNQFLALPERWGGTQ